MDSGARLTNGYTEQQQQQQSPPAANAAFAYGMVANGQRSAYGAVDGFVDGLVTRASAMGRLEVERTLDQYNRAFPSTYRPEDSYQPGGCQYDSSRRY